MNSNVVKFSCPHCNQTLKVSSEMAGTALRMKHLSNTVMLRMAFLIVSFALPLGSQTSAFAEQPTDNSITSTTGEVYHYEEISATPKGVDLVSRSGHSSFAWTEVLPNSLPEYIRDQHREAVVALLKKAYTAFTAKDYITALDLILKAKGHTDYLSSADKSELWAADIEKKTTGLLLIDGKWLDRSRILEVLGFVKVDDNWVSPEEQSQRKERKISVVEAISTLFAKFNEPNVSDYVTQVQTIESLFNELVRDDNNKKATDVVVIKEIKQYLSTSVIHVKYAAQLYGIAEKYSDLSRRALDVSQARFSRYAESDSQSSNADAEKHIKDAKHNYRRAYDLFTRSAQMLGVKNNSPALSSQCKETDSAEDNQTATTKLITSTQEVSTDEEGFAGKTVFFSGEIRLESPNMAQVLAALWPGTLSFEIKDSSGDINVITTRDLGAPLRQKIIKAGGGIRGVFTVAIIRKEDAGGSFAEALIAYDPPIIQQPVPPKRALTPASNAKSPEEITSPTIKHLNIPKKDDTASAQPASPQSPANASPSLQKQVFTSDTPAASIGDTTPHLLSHFNPEVKQSTDEKQIRKELLDLGGGVTLPVVWVSSGEFDMGDKIESPIHHVRLSKGFWMGQCEVTQEQWQQIMGNNPSYYTGAKNPVEQVSWTDCQEFILKLNGKVGTDCLVQRDSSKVPRHYFFRLPTEAEWEYACRAGTKTLFFTGNEIMGVSEVAWHGNNSGGKTHPVGQKKPNPWGLYDMHGNVMEWCQDWCGPYESDTTTDPVGPQGGKYKVCRGGTFEAVEVFCSSTARFGLATPSISGDSIGFRIVVVY